MAKNFPNLLKNIKCARSSVKSKQDKLEKIYVRHTIFKLLKGEDRERTLKAARKQQFITYTRSSIIFTADFSSETMTFRGQWDVIFKVLWGEGKNSIASKLIFVHDIILYKGNSKKTIKVCYNEWACQVCRIQGIQISSISLH